MILDMSLKLFCLQSDFVVLFWPVLQRRAVDGDGKAVAPIGLVGACLFGVYLASAIISHGSHSTNLA